MELGFDLYQEQTQKLMMTTQMRQAIHVLRCTSEELQSYLDDFIQQNPIVEYSKPSFARSRVVERSHGNPIEQTIASKQGLSEILLEQISLASVPQRLVPIVQFLIGSLDENGYLTECDEDLAMLCGAHVADVTSAVSILQSFDPPGIGARNLRECLLLQLPKSPEMEQGLVRAIILRHLDDVAAGRVAHVMRALSATHEAVQSALDTLKRLNPRPGLVYGQGVPEYIVPELMVRKIGTVYEVFPNDSARFHIRVDDAYQSMFARVQDLNAQRYLKHHIQSALWVSKCLEQRQITLQRVGQAIVEVQRDFFDEGPTAMKPMTLRQIAEQIEMHESTVSRAVRGKYMQTPRGVIELKTMFSAQLASDSGVTSAQTAKYWIQQLIAQESPAQPLSDEELVREMRQHGIHLSRRTVAKYREELRIPSSMRRRRFA